MTPHIAAILRGRGMYKDGKLLCCATRCLFEDSEYGRDIIVKGEILCPNCKAKVHYHADTERGISSDLEFDEGSQRFLLKCPACKKIISLRLIKWTQTVVSKHHRGRHLYYHKECNEAMYHDIPDDEGDSSDEEL